MDIEVVKTKPITEPMSRDQHRSPTSKWSRSRRGRRAGHLLMRVIRLTGDKNWDGHLPRAAARESARDRGQSGVRTDGARRACGYDAENGKGTVGRIKTARPTNGGIIRLQRRRKQYIARLVPEGGAADGADEFPALVRRTLHEHGRRTPVLRSSYFYADEAIKGEKRRQGE